MRRRLLHAGYAFGLMLLVAFAAEITTRIEDRLRYDTDLLHSPDFDNDLFEPQANGDRRGKPFGRYQKWRLNQFGFRSSEVEIKRSSDRKRIMLIGSSETFGMFESPGKDYPAQLLSELNRFGDYEVINTALPGMTLRSATRAFDDRFARFSPDVVVIYVSPLFYLNMSPKKESASSKPTGVAATATARPQLIPRFQLRFERKLRDALVTPEFLQRRIDAKTIESRRDALGANSVFTSFPQDQLDMFISDLNVLVQNIKDCGAKPLLVTHAIQSHSPPTPDDLRALQSSLVHTPRATPQLVLDFEAANREQILALAKSQSLTVVDLAQALNGRREAFGDLVHFSDTGAAIAAQMIAETISRHPSATEPPGR